MLTIIINVHNAHAVLYYNITFQLYPVDAESYLNDYLNAILIIKTYKVYQ